MICLRNTCGIQFHQNGKHFFVQRRLIILIRFNETFVYEGLLVFFGTSSIEPKNRICKTDQLDAIVKCFQKIGGVTRKVTGSGIGFLQRGKGGVVSGFMSRTALNPSIQSFFKSFFLSQHTQGTQSLIHAHCIFPVVGTSGELAGIFDANRIVLSHGVPPYLLFSSTHFDAGFVFRLHLLADSPRRHVTLCTARVTHSHGKITFVDACQRDGNHVFRFIGYVRPAKIGRPVFLIGIYPEDRKVSGMTRPHPIVGIAPKFTDRRGGRDHQAYITKNIVKHHIIFVTTVIRDHAGSSKGVIFILTDQFIGN